MASKGPKNGGKPTAPKSAPRPKSPVAPKPKLAAPKAEKPAPVAEVEVVAPPVIETLAAVPEAVPQEVETPVEALAETVEPPVEAVVAETIEPAVEAAAEPVTETAELVEVAAEPVVETVEVAEAAVEPVVEAVEETIAAAAIPPAAPEKKEVIMDSINKAQAAFAEFNDRAKAAVEKSTKLVEEFNDFAKGNVEAVVESGKITAKGLEAFGQEAADYSRKSFESATATLKSLSSVKSPTEFFKLQSDFVRQSFDSYVAEASKNTEALIKLAGDAAQPISSRFAVAVEKAKIAA